MDYNVIIVVVILIAGVVFFLMRRRIKTEADGFEEEISQSLMLPVNGFSIRASAACVKFRFPYPLQKMQETFPASFFVLLALRGGAGRFSRKLVRVNVSHRDSVEKELFVRDQFRLLGVPMQPITTLQ